MKLLFDIGGTHLRAARAAPDGISEPRIVQTPVNPKEALRALAALGNDLAADVNEKIESAAGGVAGIIDSHGAILFSPNLRDFEGFSFAAELGEAIGAPAQVVNDAAVGALGEATYGAGKGAHIVAYIAVGTGVGGARVVDGHLDRPAAGFEPGHHILDAHSGTTLEALVAGRAIEARAGVASAADAPRQLYDELTPLLAAGIYNAILFWSPDVMVLGGSVMRENGYRVGELSAALARLPKIFPALPPLKTAALSDASGLWGARALSDSGRA
ncbi:MAG: ROK family protein [Minisyncoccia bacterium]